MSSKRRRPSASNQPQPPATPRPESPVQESIGMEMPAAKPTPRQSMPEMEKIGSILRRVREQRKEKLEHISDYLRIRRDYLIALENSRYDELPADAYVIGFLRTYANYLDLDGKGAIDQYRREMAGRRRKPQLVLPQPISEGRAPTAVILISATIAALLLYAMWYGFSSSERAVVTTPPAIPQTAAEAASARENATPAPVVAAEPTAAVATTATAAVTTSTPVPAALVPIAGEKAPEKTAEKPETAQTDTAAETKTNNYGNPQSNSRVMLRVDKQSWVLVTDRQGNTIFDHILKPGDTYKPPNMRGLTLTTGNGGGIVLNLDGVDMPRLSEQGRVIRNVPLDADLLKSYTPDAD